MQLILLVKKVVSMCEISDKNSEKTHPTVIYPSIFKKVSPTSCFLPFTYDQELLRFVVCHAYNTCVEWLFTLYKNGGKNCQVKFETKLDFRPKIRHLTLIRFIYYFWVEMMLFINHFQSSNGIKNAINICWTLLRLAQILGQSNTQSCNLC